LADGCGGAVEQAEGVLLVFLGFGLALGASEEIVEFLAGEVDVVVAVRVRVFCGVESVVLPQRV